MSAVPTQNNEAAPLPAVPICLWLSAVQMPGSSSNVSAMQRQDIPQGLAPLGTWCTVPMAAVPMMCPVSVPMAGTVAPLVAPLACLSISEPSSSTVTPLPSPAASTLASPAPAAPAPPVLGNVWRLSQDPVGSRRVQDAIDSADNDQARLALASELKGHVWDALQCPHANHVLQRCIVSLRSPALQFILDELVKPRASQVAQAARHRYGCRILQRLFEHCRQDQLEEFIDELMASAVSLSKHAYANFVMQHVLEYGAPEYRRRLTGILEQHAKAMVKDEHGHAVLSKAMANASREEQLRLARALLRENGLLLRMARGRHGHVAVKAVLDVLEGQEQEIARKQLLDSVAKLRLSRYGRSVAASLV